MSGHKARQGYRRPSIKKCEKVALWTQPHNLEIKYANYIAQIPICLTLQLRKKAGRLKVYCQMDLRFCHFSWDTHSNLIVATNHLVHPYRFVCSLLFYLLATFKVISGRVPTFDSEYSWLLYSAPSLGHQAAGTMTSCYPTQSHYLHMEPTSPFPILIMPITRQEATSISQYSRHTEEAFRFSSDA